MKKVLICWVKYVELSFQNNKYLEFFLKDVENNLDKNFNVRVRVDFPENVIIVVDLELIYVGVLKSREVGAYKFFRVMHRRSTFRFGQK